MATKEEKLQKIKEDLKTELHKHKDRQRFGCFSYYPSHGFGLGADNSRPVSRKDDKGNITVGPKNFFAGAYASGKLFNDGFNKASYLSEADPYVDPYKIINKFRTTSQEKMSSTHGKAFRPSGSKPNLIKASFEYIPESVNGDSKKSRPGTAASTRKNSELISPKNFINNPPKKGFGDSTTGHLFSPHPEYMSDPFERLRDHHKKERREHWAKINQPFHLTFQKSDGFSSNMEVYHIPDGLKHKNNRKSQVDTSKPPFRYSNPPKEGYNKTINPFPEYAPEVEEENTNSRPQSRPVSAAPWRYTQHTQSMPHITPGMYNFLYRGGKK